jgi:hypothetical protein
LKPSPIRRLFVLYLFRRPPFNGGMTDHATLFALLDDLEPETIQACLDDLDRQQRALRILLRATRARRRSPGKQKPHTLPTTTSALNARVDDRLKEGGGQ